MKKLPLIATLLALPVAAEDTRQFVQLAPPAQETLRLEMLDNLLALNEILALLADDKIKEAGALAEERLGRGAMGKNARLPFDARPGPQMPRAMHDIGRAGHDAASAFAQAASGGDRRAALEKLPAIMNACIGCHASYRTR